MSTDLVAWINARLDKSALADEAKLIVMVALEGDSELEDLLNTGKSEVRERAVAQEVPDAGGTFLASVTVEGFRGIGPATLLN
ncbi:hypothetical protein ncot_11890 [Nocardioides sp. JQ2195]|uniref:hypothetical protein n=1 Tax=Nocardioides sp. JQ2195 TaxID=2592334 RepID=UPI00143E3CC7|nr:hypothetical protein [Nocardioides sp. JQ2195]QIX27222.1 hypothetical protein ncot_11890 [Nocardioides sp. JQ2195]